jgi:hypothetical protein
MSDEPLIYTSKGNVPIASLKYEYAWEDTDNYTKFKERYLDASGEVVKEGAHVFMKKGVTALMEAGGVG